VLKINNAKLCVSKYKNNTVKGYRLGVQKNERRRKEWIELIGRIELSERTDICEV